MNYLQPSKRRISPGKRALKIVSVFIAVIFIFSAIFPSLIPGALGPVGTFLWKTRDIFSGMFSYPLSIFYSKKDLAEKNELLESKIAELESEILSLRVLNKESVFLEESLERKVRENSVVSRVLAKPPQSPFDTLIIESGSREGVFSGAQVWSRGIVIGLVFEAGRTTSKVELFSSSGKETNAEILRNGLSFPLKGRGAGNFEVSVPTGADVVSGDIFVIPGSNNQILAEVKYIEEKETDSFKKLFLSSPISIFSIQSVEVEIR